MGKTDELCAFDWLNRAGCGSVGHSGAGTGRQAELHHPCSVAESCFTLVSLGGDYYVYLPG